MTFFFIPGMILICKFFYLIMNFQDRIRNSGLNCPCIRSCHQLIRIGLKKAIHGIEKTRIQKLSPARTRICLIKNIHRVDIAAYLSHNLCGRASCRPGKFLNSLYCWIAFRKHPVDKIASCFCAVIDRRDADYQAGDQSNEQNCNDRSFKVSVCSSLINPGWMASSTWVTIHDWCRIPCWNLLPPPHEILHGFTCFRFRFCQNPEVIRRSMNYMDTGILRELRPAPFPSGLLYPLS